MSDKHTSQSHLARLIAFYLPQFHPIPENDAWWGRGFTEWTNVTKAQPLFKGHYQPHLPADLGFYDLRIPDVREAQADLARVHGIEGFCYYHYWFAGKQLLERPFQEVVRSKRPDFPFCLCWANESWTGIWHGAPGRILIEQNYPGPEDDEAHFNTLREAFLDPRHIKVEGKPLFVIYRPELLPEPKRILERWRTMAVRAGLKGLYLVGMIDASWVPADHGFDASTTRNLQVAKWRLDQDGAWRRRFRSNFLKYPEQTYDYEAALPHLLLAEGTNDNVFPCAIPNWDNTPRSGMNGLVLHGSTPELFRRHVRAVIQQVQHKPQDRRVVFLKSWNEWAEGNHLEPDQRFGRAYLEVVRKEVASIKSNG